MRMNTKIPQANKHCVEILAIPQFIALVKALDGGTKGAFIVIRPL